MYGLIPINQNLEKARVDQVGHKWAVVTPDGLNSLAVHLVIGVWSGVVQPCIALLVDQQIREVHLE